MNIRLDIEYEGTEFYGWQRQVDRVTIQQTLEEAIEHVHGHRSPLQGASRTDSGVHAQGQVANFHTDARMDPTRWSLALNSLLPPSIRVVRSMPVEDAFNATKDALSKLYTYRVLNRKHASALDRRVYFCPHSVDWDVVRQALPYFVGEKDFRSFQGAKALTKTSIRRVDRFELFEEECQNGEGGLYRFEVEGKGFLKQMVRNMVGTVLEVGEGKRTPEEMEAVIASRDRTMAGRTAQAVGLCLVKVDYPV